MYTYVHNIHTRTHTQTHNWHLWDVMCEVSKLANDPAFPTAWLIKTREFCPFNHLYWWMIQHDIPNRLLHFSSQDNIGPGHHFMMTYHWNMWDVVGYICKFIGVSS